MQTQAFAFAQLSVTPKIDLKNPTLKLLEKWRDSLDSLCFEFANQYVEIIPPKDILEKFRGEAASLQKEKERSSETVSITLRTLKRVLAQSSNGFFESPKTSPSYFLQKVLALTMCLNAFQWLEETQKKTDLISAIEIARLRNLFKEVMPSEASMNNLLLTLRGMKLIPAEEGGNALAIAEILYTVEIFFKRFKEAGFFK